MTDREKKRLDKLLKGAADIIRSTSDAEIIALLGDGIIDELLKAIALPKANKDQTIYDYLLENKNRLALLALIRHVITLNYSIKGRVREIDCFASPTYYQWFDDGVMFLQGKNRFEGLIALYQGGKVKFAITARDKKSGDPVGPEDLLFIDVEDAEKRANEKSIPKRVEQLDQAALQLESMLDQRETNEAKYQDYLQNNPWVLGAQYNRIDSHKSLDDIHIPDFTGVRVRDHSRDIIEIKQPFLPIFRDDRDFRAEFNSAWNQMERYLDFTRRESDYLYRQKGLRFDNPHCYLLIGFNLSGVQIKALRRKERMNPAITILTYNDVVTMAKSTVEFIRVLKSSKT